MSWHKLTVFAGHQEVENIGGTSLEGVRLRAITVFTYYATTRAGVHERDRELTACIQAIHAYDGAAPIDVRIGMGDHVILTIVPEDRS